MGRLSTPHPPPGSLDFEGSEDPSPPRMSLEESYGDDYRAHLEETTSPPNFRHSPTLSFSHIYVVSLEKRADRRAQMTKLARALRIQLTFVDALDKGTDGVMGWIGERVLEVRKKKIDLLVRARRGTLGQIGGGGIGSVWLDGSSDRSIPWPNLASDRRWGGKDWVQYLFQADLSTLEPDKDFDLKRALFDPLEKNERRQINEGVIATWFSHVKALQLMKENEDGSALILEVRPFPSSLMSISVLTREMFSRMMLTLNGTLKECGRLHIVDFHRFELSSLLVDETGLY